MNISSLYNGDPSKIAVLPDQSTGCAVYYLKQSGGRLKRLENPNLILFSALNPPPGKTMGVSILRGLSGSKQDFDENISMYRTEL